MSSIRRQCEAGDGVSGLRQMIRDMDYEEWLNQLSSSEDVAQRRMANVHFLVDSLQRVMNSEQVGLDEMDPVPDMIDTFEIFRAGSPDHPVDLVAFFEEEIRQVRSVLTCDPRDQCFFLHGFLCFASMFELIR